MKQFTFPAGESHIHASPFFCDRLNIIGLKPDQLNHTLISILLWAEVKHRTEACLYLWLPYLPYSRQDRPTTNYEPFSLKVIGGLLNSCGFNKIVTMDVHSDVAFGCVNNLVNIGIDDILYGQAIASPDKVLIIPDQGAYKRLTPIFSWFKDTVLALKHRNIDNGELSFKGLYGDVVGQDCLIVDDICDGGGTFIMLAEQLFKAGARSVELFVTHGIFSKGLDPLEKAGISKIYTTNSFDQAENMYDVDPVAGKSKSRNNFIVLDCMEIMKHHV